MKDCPSTKTTQEVQEVKGEDDGPEVLYIARTTMQEQGTARKEVNRKTPRQRTLGDFIITKPPGLSRKRRADGFRILEADDSEDDEPEVLDIRCVEC